MSELTVRQVAWCDRIEAELQSVTFFSVGGCSGCTEDHCGDDWEGRFSWSGCESCRSSLGGDRYPAHGYIHGELCHFEVCTDCLMYHANGDITDDQYIQGG